MQNPELFKKGHFHFDPQDPIYQDHFPGNPVVPGSLIIEAFMTVARPALQGPGGCSIENFRFRQFIRPGRYAFRMDRIADGCMQCTLYANDRTLVTGTLRANVPSSKFKAQSFGAVNSEP